MTSINKTRLVKDFIMDEVNAGRLTDGQRLPSCRQLAGILKMNKITVNKAYIELEQEHKVYSVPRGGFYLVEAMRKTVIANKVVDFNIVKPDDGLIPYREFSHVMSRAIETYKDSLFEYEPTTGLLSLRQTLKIEFENDGVYTDVEKIIITNGAQQAISLVMQAVFHDEGGKLLVEVPTYGLALELAENYGIELEVIERRHDGYDFKLLESFFRSGEINAFYVIPRHHNPTGYTLSEKDKQKLAVLAGKYNVIIIEDDYLADLGVRKGSLPIHYYDISKNTAYIRSFSKTFMPGIRLGAAVLPVNIALKVASLKHLNDLNTSRLPQAALEFFIKSGMYRKQSNKVKKAYDAKLRKANEILKGISPVELEWNVPQHGIFIWLRLPVNVHAAVLKEELFRQGIIIKTTEECYPKGSYDHRSVRLCIASVSYHDVDRIVTVISTIKNLL